MISTTLYQIKGFLYQLSTETINPGDLVYDIVDNTYGTCDSVTATKIKIEDGNGIFYETAPRSSIFKLIPARIQG